MSKYYIFTLNENVIGRKVTYKNRYGFEIAGELYMPKKITLLLLSALSACVLGACGGNADSPTPVSQVVEAEVEVSKTETAAESKTPVSSDSVSDIVVVEQSDSVGSGNTNNEFNDKPEIDFTKDYSEDIKADVSYVVSDSASLQEELENIEKVIQKYTPLAEAAQTQGEMNISSKWFFVIWDTELNNLWGRFSNSADQQIKEKILAEQRNWIDMKEEVTFMNIGSSEENGSMYPLLVNSFLEEITRNRAYVLANELAKVKGEPFVMPDKSAKYGSFVDNQGTGSIYSSLLTWQGQSGDDEAIISIYRQGEIGGTFVDNGNGELAFTSDDGSVKGIIKINGWEGASFTVTETSREFSFSIGEETKFPFAF